MRSSDSARHLRAQSAFQDMLFGSDNGAALARGLGDGGVIERLEGVHVNDSCHDVFFFQLRLRLQGVGDFHAAGDDGGGFVGAAAVHLGAANLKFVISCINHRRLGASSAHVAGANVLGHAMHQRAGAEFVRWHQHGEAG